MVGLVGCPDGYQKCDSAHSGCEGESEGVGEGEGEGESPVFGSSWSASGVQITISGGYGTYLLGLVETDPGSSDPWTGEDCLYGYTLETGELLLYCHPLSESGGAFSTGGSTSSLEEGSETLFDETLQDVITYAAWSDVTGRCWTWGHDVSYYADARCEAQ